MVGPERPLSSRRAIGENTFLALLIELKLGVGYLDRGRYAEAEGPLRDSGHEAARVLGDQNPFALQAISALARLDSLRSRRQRHGRVKLP